MDEVKRARNRLVATIGVGIAGIFFLIAWMIAETEITSAFLLVIVLIIVFFTMGTFELIMDYASAKDRQSQSFRSSHERSNIIVHDLDGKNPDDIEPQPSDPVTTALRSNLKNDLPPRISIS